MLSESWTYVLTYLFGDQMHDIVWWFKFAHVCWHDEIVWQCITHYVTICKLYYKNKFWKRFSIYYRVNVIYTRLFDFWKVIFRLPVKAFLNLCTETRSLILYVWPGGYKKSVNASWKITFQQKTNIWYKLHQQPCNKSWENKTYICLYRNSIHLSWLKTLLVLWKHCCHLCTTCQDFNNYMCKCRFQI